MTAELIQHAGCMISETAMKEGQQLSGYAGNRQSGQKCARQRRKAEEGGSRQALDGCD